jgi:hypothetical protein
MELTANRHTKTKNSTIGDFLLNGVFFSYCLEPTDRGLSSDMSLEQISAIKVQNKTAIPTGRYQVVKYYSPKHEAFVPLLLHVPGYAGVEIHAGNYPKDTDGCLLLGKTKDVDFVGNSQVTITRFYELFFDSADANEAVYITYKDK